MTTQKEIARILDRAAARSENPASQKKVWFLAGLMLKNGEDGNEFTLSALPLSVREASQLIEISLKSQAA